VKDGSHQGVAGDSVAGLLIMLEVFRSSTFLARAPVRHGSASMSAYGTCQTFLLTRSMSACCVVG
jgi:hypothetical protein